MATGRSTPRKLWQHPNPQSTKMWKFKTSLEQSTGRKLKDFNALYEYSCTETSDFWLHVFDHLPLVHSGKVPNPCIDESANMDTIPRWFDGVSMNYAENILFVGDKDGRPVTSPGKEDDKIAATEVREGSFVEPIRHVNWGELRQRVGKLTNAMRAHGVRKGDRIALVASNSIDTLTVFLATAAVGAMFSSSSTDMGTKGILDRLLQIKPKYLFMDDWAVYNGKKIDLRPKMKDLMDVMNKVPGFQGLVAQSRFVGQPANISTVPNSQSWDSYLSKAPSSALEFEPTDFNDPFLVVYSSGTTGQPKCIVHRHGGVVLNGYKEQALHREIDYTSTQLQFTTTGWIMYLCATMVMLTGCRMVLYDGSPFKPDLKAFVKLWGNQKLTHLGVSPKYMQSLQRENINPKHVTDLSNLKVLTTTGMVLPDDVAEWFYDQGFPPSVMLDNISGGTDIAGCFGIGDPSSPIYLGGCQGISLGFNVKVYDQTIESPGPDGKPPFGATLEDGVPGELVCIKPFPTMPVMFFGEGGAEKYHNSYFARFRHVWAHGDFIQIQPGTKQVMFLGRADGVLNPGGIRFGSAEIYSIVEKFFADEVFESICVGQRFEKDKDERVVLFLQMHPGKKFTGDLVRRIKSKVATECSKRHVPEFVFETKDIPMTVTGKKVELPVKQIISGKTVKPSGSLLNPGSLEYYYRFAKDENLVQIEKEPERIKARL